MNGSKFDNNSILTQVLKTQASQTPDKKLYYFHGENIESADYGSLYLESKKIAAHIAQYAHKGDRVLLMFIPGLNFVKAFLGCMFAGVIAVPVVPPFNKQYLIKVNNIIKSCNPKLLLSDLYTANQFHQEKLESGMAKLAMQLVKQFIPEQYILLYQLPWIKIDDLSPLEFAEAPAIAADDIAFLQYTSGSTSDPKGVLISHGNLIANLDFMRREFVMDADSVGASWVPYFHDMGLIGGILLPLFGGFPMHLMAPQDFIKQPLKWLKIISDYQVTFSGGPNFAYDYCTRKIDADMLDNLDLSSWRTAINGAEPIDVNTLLNFYNKFKICGFKQNAFHPSYGLAESTLYVCGAPYSQENHNLLVSKQALRFHKVMKVTNSEAEEAQLLVGLGKPAVDIKIINPDSERVCSPEEIGEIWIHSDSIAQGYWNNQQATAETFYEYVDEDGNKTRYLRTGDLGFIYQEQLYIVGRIKDLIIIRGQNHYPQDIEKTIVNSKLIATHNVQAFSIKNADHEELVVVIESTSSNVEPTIYQSISQVITQEHGITPFDIVLVSKRSLPTTSSGKKQRNKSREYYLRNKFKILDSFLKDRSTLWKLFPNLKIKTS